MNEILINEMLKLLKKANEVLKDHFFRYDGQEEYNNDDIIDMNDDINRFLQKIENQPSRCPACLGDGRLSDFKGDTLYTCPKCNGEGILKKEQ